MANTLNIVQAVNQALMNEMENDPSVVVYGEDVGVEGGVFRATVGLQEKFGVQRAFDAPLAESAIVGTAIGMAINGLKPVVELQFMGFSYPAFNQIISHVARMRNRSRGRYTLPMVIRAPYGGGIRALEHHSESTEALYAHIPGLKVVIPSTPYDAKGLLIAAIRDPDPVLFLEPKRIYRAFKQEIPEEAYVLPIGKAKVVEEGEDVTIITWGAMVRDVQKASEMVKSKGINPEIIDLRTISPMDRDSFIESVKKTGRAIVVHEAPKSFGAGAEIVSIINEKAFLYLEAPPTRVTGFDTIFPLPRGEKHYIPTPERIAKTIEDVVKF
ncbi:alpha-ketoacid dehydrogenase subunit beta [Tissierella sp. P1]|jgi:pyruvate dehydrogenase E1 component beta subunit|uniref:Alpha-ketoacid dehydrogenase subunit beta n=1 Tax=Tissierella carlieri TaxID=689904 RepID=A0ABT1SA94_9FIRM|nr:MULTISPECIES: alpha-ketoacid dehydrogenase subunit beta [Tissierella]MCQ4923393.1 alpha-ketoacid dehydrogenase subunit beta [Tissierella carlieri]MDU5082492.1 alpha-ketoacid dehydrogenase subunit beta [Bacillota bacterium]OZV12012.1 alpha-ketoacid dehydrogenase subunit beta [Tissierella sp. P1]